MKRNLAALAEGREYDTAEPTVTMTQAQLDAAIAAAVQAEREANIAAMPITRDIDTSQILGWSDMTAEEKRMWKAGYFCGANDYQDAIRARSNGEGSK